MRPPGGVRIGDAGLLDDEGAEPSGDVEHALDVVDGLLRGPDHAVPDRGQQVDHRVGVVQFHGNVHGQDLPDVLDVGGQSPARLAAGLFRGLGDVQRAHHRPPAPVHGLPRHRGLLGRDLERRRHRVLRPQSDGGRGAKGQHPGAVLARQPGPGRRPEHSDPDVERLAERPQLQEAAVQGEPVGLAGHRAVEPQQRGHGLERLLHHAPRLHRIVPDHPRVQRQHACANAEDQPSPAQVVQLDDPVQQGQRMVVGQCADASPEPDAGGLRSRRRDHELRRADDLPAA
jgi:hypothetical protein